jgi:HYR domain
VGEAIDASGTGGDLTIDQTSVVGAIDVSGTGGDLTIDQASVGGAIDVSGTGGDLTITDNGVEVVDAGETGGDVTISGNLDSETITVGETGGDLTITDNGASVVNPGNGQVGGNATIETGGDSFSGTTAGGSTSVTILGGTATMHVGLPKEAFAQPVGFTITRHTDSSGAGTAADGTSAVIDPVAGFEFAFDVPTLNADAQLSFVVDMSRLDAQGRADLLNALGSGAATIVGKGNDPGATYRAFVVCSGSQAPSADGCVAISSLAADGTPTTGNPAFVRFDGVVGHFSTYAVATVMAEQRDTTPPVVTVPADLAVDATGPAGSKVTYAAPAKDDTDPSPTVACSPASGNTFAIGTTDVTCTATDASGNHAAASFRVHVRGAGEQIARLIDKTLAFLDQPALGPALRSQLQTAFDAFAGKHPKSACLALDLYVAAVKLAPARTLTQAEKTELVADARRIRAVVGC